MAVITISIDDDIERRFREVAKRVIGEKKGYLRQAVSEALQLWVEQKDQERIAADALAILESGYHLGKKRYAQREDLYETGPAAR
jgi:predicted transcriptional regulator